MKRLLAIAALAGLSSVAWANDSGLYAGAGIGVFNVEISNVNSGTFKGDDTTLKVFAGWRMNSFFAFELDYIDLGQTSDTVGGINYKSEINGVAPYAVGTLALGPIEVFGKLGYYFYDVKFSGTGVSTSDSSEDLTYALGVGMTLFGRLNARLEYEIIDIEGTKDSNALWLTGAWRF